MNTIYAKDSLTCIFSGSLDGCDDDKIVENMPM